MNPNSSIPRDLLAWLLGAQCLVILPHLGHLPLWILPLWLGCLFWRLQIFRLRARPVGTRVKLLLMLASGFAVYLSRGQLVSLDAAALLLVIAFTLKMLEMRTRRDVLVVVLLGFFTISVGYLFQDGLLSALYSLLPILALLRVLAGLYQPTLPQLPQVRPLQRILLMLLQALPLMLLLFVFFPRLAPLWGLPQPSDQALSGLGDTVAPGEVARLALSRQAAFRVSFEGDPPPQAELYWRAMTYERFDGARWLRGEQSRQRELPAWTRTGGALDYSVVMQPSGRAWLPVLDVAELPASAGRMRGDFHFESRQAVRRPLLYRVRSWPQALREPDLSRGELQFALQLPDGNPQSRELAQALRAEHAGPDALVAALLAYFRDQPFSYTLQPPALGTALVDDFLFRTRAGFCTHYASAATFVLRAAGIPARVVGGYQGGRQVEAGDYLLVRQMDAHAWVEYWVAGRGWQRLDPTFAVAPERINLGMEATAAERASSAEGSDSEWSGLGRRGWLLQVQLFWDQLDYSWQRWVLNYQGDSQRQFFRRLSGLDREDWVRWGGSALLVVAMVGALRTWRRRAPAVDGPQQVFRRFEQRLAREGIVRAPGEGARVLEARAIARWPEQAAAISGFVRAYEAARYARDVRAAGALVGYYATLQRLLRRRL